jgi:hypothetical protein
MYLTYPAALGWALLAIPLVLLYVRREPVRREVTSTGAIWQQVFAAHRFRARWQRWRHPASLVLHLLILGLIVLALAQPETAPPRRMVVIVDNARQAAGTADDDVRLADIRALGARLVAGLRPCDEMAVLSAGVPARVECGLTNCRRELYAALDGLAPARGPARVGQAQDVAERVLAGRDGGTTVVLRGPDDAQAMDEAGGLTLWPYLAGAAVLLIVSEWFLYVRRWMP